MSNEGRKMNECDECERPDYIKAICHCRDYPFSWAKTEYKDINCVCSQIKKEAKDENHS
jgi:hypothetical protein